MICRPGVALGALLATIAPALAADPPALRLGDAPAEIVPARPTFFVHAGIAGLLYDLSARVSQGGVPIPGAAVRIEDALTFAVEGGYYLTPNIAASVTAGFPPISKVVAAGTLSGLGPITKAQGGPASVTVHYHLDGFGAFQPYVGAGVAALIVFNDEDRLLRRSDTKNTLGPVVQGGFDLMMTDRWGVFFDVKKAFLTPKTKGTIAGVPVSSRITLDPLVMHTGVTYRF